MFTDVIGVLWIGLEGDLGRAKGTFLSVSVGLAFLTLCTYDIESENLDSIILFTDGSLFTSVELLSFP
jgi:uncharacterized membrane protein YccC